MHPVRRGDIYYADLSPVVGSEQGGMRPVLIIQNDTGNRHSPTVIAAAITSQTGKANLPTHISLAARSCGLTRDSVILLEQVRTLDKSRLRERMGRLDEPASRSTCRWACFAAGADNQAEKITPAPDYARECWI